MEQTIPTHTTNTNKKYNGIQEHEERIRKIQNNTKRYKIIRPIQNNKKNTKIYKKTNKCKRVQTLTK